jgi:uncharacterized protein (TIGR02757 family)
LYIPQSTIDFLNIKVEQFNTPNFIDKDPICIPHLFTKKQDIEIAGFLAATIAWGNRTTIINNAKSLMTLMDNSPHDFICNHQSNDLKKFLSFKHRTFNATDLLYFISFLQFHYATNASLETAFISTIKNNNDVIEHALTHFHNYFFSLQDFPTRTKKHVATPIRNSACKRLNMYLRWMVRNDKRDVDFGIWENIKPIDLIIPLDVHVCNVATRLGLLQTSKANWKQAIELTNVLRTFDKNDPTKYDFALFGLGVIEKFV